jgi:DNA-binding NarL/FixJ family response regulator
LGVFMPSKINLVIADDHDRLRSSLSDFLDSCSGLQVVGTAANGDEAFNLCGQLNPDVVLMDIRMPGMDGITATAAIHEQYPDIQIIALTSGIRAEAEAAVAAGASGYIFKSVSVYEIVDMIRSIYAKNTAADAPPL